ncbi:MAG: hypothetical protein KC546_06140 [Anaerolineae bacterium]|nr:hypothetical protein [Anaerolineae bacterium]MCA9893711.1 hypothetical protein [Anaerolineae bacterium]
MPVEHHILMQEPYYVTHFKFTGEWESQDYFRAIDKSQEKRRIQFGEQLMTRPIATILDFDIAEKAKSPALSMFASASKRSPNNMVLVVVIGNMFVKVMTNSFGRLYPKLPYELRGAKSLEEAWQIINSHIEEHGDANPSLQEGTA